ncbi:MAG: NHL repeat-containing protein [Spirochaetia bacterium]|nr:NHL repeat-containing protein [Spirochaetia bacterium]
MPSLRIKEEEARDSFRKGITFYNAGQYAAAREFFYKSLNKVSYFHLARRYLGDANYYSGEWNSALEQWEFLDRVSEGSYPLIRMRSDLLRFKLNGFKNVGPYIHYRSFGKLDFPEMSAERPVDSAVDSQGNLYFLFSGSANLIVSNPGTTAFRQIRGRLFDRFKGPVGLTLVGDKVYIADYSDDRIRIMDLDGSELLSFGGTGSGPGQFRGPAGVVVSSNAIFVTDSGNKRVQKFDLTGKYLLTFLAEDAGLTFPAGVALDQGLLYIADRNSSRILVFDEDGNYQDQIESNLMSKPRGVSFADRRLIVADEEAGVLFYDLVEKSWNKLEVRTKDDQPLSWTRPFSARTDSNGVLYVSEFGSGRIHVFMPEALRISNLDCRVERVDTSSFPDIAIFVQMRNRLGSQMPGLTRNEIRIFENDRFIRGTSTDSMDNYQSRVNLMFVKESDATLAEPEQKEILSSLLGKILAPIRISDRIAVIRAGETVRSVYEGLQRREIIRSITEGEVIDRPDVGKGIVESLSRLVTAMGPRAVIVLVSGAERHPFHQYPSERIEFFARAQGIPIYVISFEMGQSPDVTETYKSLATATGGEYIRAYDDTAIRDLYPKIRARRDERYILTYHSNLTADLADRYIELRVDVAHQGMTGSAEGGYFVPSRAE